MSFVCLYLSFDWETSDAAATQLLIPSSAVGVWRWHRNFNLKNPGKEGGSASWWDGASSVEILKAAGWGEDMAVNSALIVI